MALRLLFSRYAAAINSENGVLLADLLDFEQESVSGVSVQLRNLNTVQAERTVSQFSAGCGLRSEKGEWKEVMVAHTLCRFYRHQGRACKAYEALSSAVTTYLNKSLDNEDPAWSIAVFYRLTSQLRDVAIEAELEFAAGSSPEETTESPVKDCARVLMLAFRITHRDRSTEPNSKRWVLLRLINGMFKLYFKMKDDLLPRCKHLLKLVQNLPPLQSFPLSQRVTFNYYAGRLDLLNQEYQKADEKLTFAFEKCTPAKFHNKRLILTYLIPVKLLRGKFPTTYLLQKYKLTQYLELPKAIKSGDMKLLESVLEEHQELFIRQGILLILESLKLFAWRNLFKRVFTITKNDSAKLSILRLVHLCTAVRLHKAKVDSSTEPNPFDISDEEGEVECLVANLIYRGYMKGYISHERKVVVLDKKEPFPPIKSVING